MSEVYEFEVSFHYTENFESKKAQLTIQAKSESEALQKAKEQLSLHRGGKNYQVISGAAILRK
jgi:hypothetical protein